MRRVVWTSVGVIVAQQRISARKEGAAALVRDAKRRGLPVTCEATPHHLTLTDLACASYDPHTKVMPPLRSDADVVVASSSGWAHGFDASGRTGVYCHNPARWLYQTDEYLGGTAW